MRAFTYVESSTYGRLLLLCFFIVAAYYPVLSTGICSVDDLSMIQKLSSSTFSWLHTFTPGDTYYYRPLLNLSFRFDQWAWNFMPASMHLENLVIHLANTILVYFLSKCFYRGTLQSQPSAPWLAAMLFGLHPLATESVNWISGRTDLLAGFFVFLGMLAIFRALSTGRYRWLLVAALACTIATLTKEVMVFSIPAALFLILLYSGNAADGTMALERPKASMVFLGPLVLLLGVFLAVRWEIRAEAAMGISDVVLHNHHGPLNWGVTYFKVFGFYVKKFFWPMPLNFAITKISFHYVWLGLAATLGLFWRAKRGSWLWVPWIMAGMLLLPNFFIALADVAWTPFAERYAYLAASFWAIGLVGFWAAVAPRLKCSKWLGVLLLLLIGCHTFATAQRNQIWQNNLSLFADTVAKSPNHVGARNELGNAMFLCDMLEDAKKQYEVGLTLAAGWHPQLTFNLARVYIALQQPTKARRLLLKAMEQVGAARIPLAWLKMLALADAKLLKISDNSVEGRVYGLELLDIYEAIYSQDPRPEILSQAGQLALRLGEEKRSAKLLARAQTSVSNANSSTPQSE